MKVAFYTKEFPPNIYGGAGVHVDYLSKALSNLLEVEVRCFGNQNEKSETLSAEGYAIDKDVLTNLNTKLTPIFETLGVNLKMNYSEVNADVVHCHTWYAHFAGILAKLMYNIPLVITTHSLEPLRPWKREQLGNGYNVSSWVEKTAIEMADAIIAVSDETKQDVLKYFNIPHEKISVIYNGIDLKEYTRVDEITALERYGVDPSSPYVLFVGRITHQKGIIHLVNAIKYINAGVQVVLCAGAPDTPEIAREMAQRVTEAQKNREGVIWIDKMLDKKEIIQFYSHASIFCCPSIYEPFGIINVEAMACETAVVAAAVGGIKEVVVDNETGFLVPLEQHNTPPFMPVDPDRFSQELADKINMLINDEALRRSMAKKGRKRVEDHFDWDSIARDTANLYNNLITKHNDK